jgi:hypothetical protein
MAATAASLADRLLDAQVDFIIGQLTGDEFPSLIARDVDDVLTVASGMVLAEVVDAERVKQTGRTVLERVGASDLVEDLVAAIAEAIYDLAASEEYRLGEVIGREPVAALVAKVLSMDPLYDRAMERLAESPMVATIASRFVGKIVGDFVQTNRAKVEKVPGVSSMLSIGTSAAKRVTSVGDALLGDAAGKGANFALKRTNTAIRDLIADAPLQDAALELWDLHADEPISGLREYMSRQDLRELVLMLHDIITEASTHDYAGNLLDACIDVFFERYGSRDVTSVLADVGVTRDTLIAEIVDLAPPIIAAAVENGELRTHIRSRLEPFYRSEAFVAIVAG